MAPRANILVVEDKQNEREALCRLLRMEGHSTHAADSAESANDFIDKPVDLVMSDLRMGPASGLDLLRHWKKRRPRVTIVMITAYGDVETAVEAMKVGAEDYLRKPVNPDELLLVVKRCLEMGRKDATIENLQARLDRRLGFEKIIGRSPIMLDMFDQARRAALVDSTVLITGESGTGKELLAEAIHQNSPRKKAPFVTVNMAAVPENLVESELFGHTKGAFTGAMEPRVGRFESADGGTIFIDEIGDFALPSQSKLLRVLEDHKVTPVGSNDNCEVNVRVVAATSHDLEERVRNEEFREDLYYRLAVVTLRLPPLRERRDDIPLLVSHFLDEICRDTGKESVTIDPPLMRFLESYDWPGNVRQLKNCLESMVVLARQSRLTLDDLPSTIGERRAPSHSIAVPTGVRLEELERAAIEKALDEYGGNRTHAAHSLGISVRTLQRKLKTWNSGSEDADRKPLPR